MKRVCIDTSLAGRNDGTGRVSYNLTKELLKDPKYEYILIEYKKDLFPEFHGTKIISKWSGRGQIRALWYLFVLPFILFRYKIDIFYSYEAFSTPIVFKGKTILTIHDLIPLTIPNYYTKVFHRMWFKFRVWFSTRKQREVIAVSKFTKQEIGNYFPIFKGHIHVVYNALDERFKHAASALPKEFNLSSKGYILGIGGMEKRKNNILTVSAYSNILMKNPTFPLDLVIIGMGNQAYANVKGSDNTIPKEYMNRIHFLPGVSNDELAILFSNAYMFVFPSLYEGFGMPILEAMAVGVPVIALNKTSLPEVVGDAGILIQDDSEELKQAIETLTSDKQKYKEYITKGKTQVQKFSWSEGARSIESIVDMV